MIVYKNISKVRRELENMLLLVDELEERGIPRYIIIDAVKNEFGHFSKTYEYPGKDQQN